jgi:SAM-dependent methyltransferase
MRLLYLLLLTLPLPAQTGKPPIRWDDIYRGTDSKVPVNPSSLVLETTANLKPGDALDIGMGNGRNAVYLARKGWKVTGIDPSREAVRLAQAQAAKLGVAVDARVARFEDHPLYRSRYDLVLCLYVSDVATKNARKIVDMLRPGGLLVIEGFHTDAQSGTGANGYRNNELLRVFGKLRVLRYEDTVEKADWATSADNRAPIVRLVARKE